MKKITISLFALLTILLSSCDKPTSLVGTSWSNKEVVNSQNSYTRTLIFKSTTDVTAQAKIMINGVLQNEVAAFKYSYDGANGTGKIISGSMVINISVKSDILTTETKGVTMLYTKDN